MSVGHWRITYDPRDGEPVGDVCRCEIDVDHDIDGEPVEAL